MKFSKLDFNTEYNVRRNMRYWNNKCFNYDGI